MTKDISASVRARLLNLAKAQRVDFNAVLVRFALERFLYRLSQSKYADQFQEPLGTIGRLNSGTPMPGNSSVRRKTAFILLIPEPTLRA